MNYGDILAIAIPIAILACIGCALFRARTTRKTKGVVS